MPGPQPPGAQPAGPQPAGPQPSPPADRPSGPPPNGTPPTGPYGEPGRHPLGFGLALRPTGPGSIGHDLVFTGPGTSGDLALAADADNLAQDLTVALLTAPGTDPLNVGFGFDGLRVLSRSYARPMVVEMLRLSVLRTLTADARVTEVLDLTLTETDPPGSRRWTVAASVRTVSGEVADLTIGEVTADA